jgi:hypothetical protein
MNLVRTVTTYSISIERPMMDILAAERSVIFNYREFLGSKLEELDGVSSADYSVEDSAIFVSINAQDDDHTTHRVISRTIIAHLIMCQRRLRERNLLKGESLDFG